MEGMVRKQGPPIERICIVTMIVNLVSILLILYFRISELLNDPATFIAGVFFPPYLIAGYIFTRNRHREIRRFWFGLTLATMVVLGVFLVTVVDYTTGLKYAPDIQTFLIKESLLILILSIMTLDLYRRKELRKVFSYGS
ncbi:MAG: hypothetical protein ACFFE2_14650 [Candidatus Thorarchaeota archaeon]